MIPTASEGRAGKRLERDTILLRPAQMAALVTASAAGLPSGAVLVYLELARVANLRGPGRWLCTAHLCARLSLPERTARHYARALAAAGLIERDGGRAAALLLPGGTALPDGADGRQGEADVRQGAAAGRQEPAGAPGLQPVPDGPAALPMNEGTQGTLPTFSPLEPLGAEPEVETVGKTGGAAGPLTDELTFGLSGAERERLATVPARPAVLALLGAGQALARRVLALADRAGCDRAGLSLVVERLAADLERRGPTPVLGAVEAALLGARSAAGVLGYYRRVLENTPANGTHRPTPARPYDRPPPGADELERATRRILEAAGAAR